MLLLLINFPSFDPIALSLGPFVIRWYALAYIGGIVIGWLYARALVKKERLWGGTPPMSLVRGMPVSALLRRPPAAGGHAPY